MTKIYLLNDYLTSKKTLKNIESWLTEKYKEVEIITIDYSKYYENTEVEKIDLNSVISYFSEELKSKIIDQDILVAIGTSCRVLTEFTNNQKILINPLVFDNLINVFTAAKKYWMNNIEQYKIYADKLFNVQEHDVEKEYEWYSSNYNKIIKLTEKISLYETLKSLIVSDTKLFRDSTVLLSDKDEILDNKSTINYLNKKLKKQVGFKLEVIDSNKHLIIK